MRDFDRYIHFPDLWKYDYACMFIQGFSGLKAIINKFRSCKFSLIYAYKDFSHVLDTFQT